MGKEIADNKALVGEIKTLIEQSKQQVSVAVNATITMLYWQVGNRINKEIGIIYISKINYRIVQRYLNKMVEKEYGSSTIRQDFSTIKIVLLQAFNHHALQALKFM